MRFITSADFTRRALFSTAQVPQGSLAFVMQADTSAVLAATTAACDASIAALGGSSPLGMLAFDCVARRGVLGQAGIEKEVQGLCDAAGGAPLAGFYSYGEIARTHGMRGLHNYTLVILSVA